MSYDKPIELVDVKGVLTFHESDKSKKNNYNFHFRLQFNKLMSFKMFFKICCFILLFVATTSYRLMKEDTNLAESNIATTKMISKLIEESKKTSVYFVNFNSELLESFLRSHNLEIAVEVNNLKPIPKSKEQKISATILHLGSCGEFEEFYRQIRPEVFLNDGHFVIIYDNGNTQEIEQMFSKLWKLYIYNVDVLVPNAVSPNLISVLTYMPFINESCDNTKIVRINDFNRTSMEWTTNDFYPKKFQQLYRCPLRFGCYDYPPSLIVTTSENGTKTFGGMAIDVANMFSKILNFSLNLIEYEQDMGLIHKNRTATGLLNKAIQNEVDLIISTLQEVRIELLSATQTVYNDKLVLVVPPPFLIDSMTKIFLPFSLVTWLCIGMVGLIACSIIISLKFAPNIVHDYLIGRNVKGSILNIWNVFLGGSQATLPESNFPRFLLSNFLIFTLIIRSLYLGAAFDILKRDVHTIELKTIDEFIEHKFTFYIYKTLAARLEGTKMMKRFVELVNNSVMKLHIFID